MRWVLLSFERANVDKTMSSTCFGWSKRLYKNIYVSIVQCHVVSLRSLEFLLALNRR